MLENDKQREFEEALGPLGGSVGEVAERMGISQDEALRYLINGVQEGRLGLHDSVTYESRSTGTLGRQELTAANIVLAHQRRTNEE